MTTVDTRAVDAVCARLAGDEWEGMPASRKFNVREHVLSVLLAAQACGWTAPEVIEPVERMKP